MASIGNTQTQTQAGQPAPAGVPANQGGAVDAHVPDHSQSQYSLGPAVLLALAPRDPISEFVRLSDVTQVKLEMVKAGEYCRRKAFFVLLEIAVPSTHIDVLFLEVIFRSITANTSNASSNSSNTASPLTAQVSTSGTHKVKTLLGSGWRSIRSGASSLCRKNPPPLSLPVICACGPRNVYGPAIRVENTDIHGWKVDPHGEGAGFGVGLGSLEGSHKQHYQLDEAPRIAVNPLGDRAEVRAEKARVGAACLPDFFHVGFVVRSEHDMMIEVVRSPKSSLAGHLSVQKSRPHVLQDTTGDGTHPLTLTCRAIDRCPHGGGRNCKEFYPSHMTEASWKEKLAFMIQSWDYGQNDAAWYRATEL